MTGPLAAVRGPFWQRRKVQATALVLVVLLAWLAHYLENLPLARAASAQDALVAGKDEAFRLDGLAPGEAITLRTLGAERLVVTLPRSTPMRMPEESAFFAKARADAAELAGVSYGSSIVLDARPTGAETASVELTLGKGDGSGALQWVRRGEDSSSPDWTVTPVGGPLSVTMELNAPPGAGAAGSIILSRPDGVARVGHAQFELAAGSTLRLEAVPRAGGAGGPPAVVELPGESSQLWVDAVEVGTETGAGQLSATKIACAAADRSYQWSSLFSGVRTGDCSEGKLAVRDIDVTAGKVAIVGRAFFDGFGDADKAHLVSALKDNLVLGYLLAALAAGVFVPWVIRLFTPKADPDVEAPAKPRRRRKSKTRA